MSEHESVVATAVSSFVVALPLLHVGAWLPGVRRSRNWFPELVAAVLDTDVAGEMTTLRRSLFTIVVVVFVPVPGIAAVEVYGLGFVSCTKYVPGLMNDGESEAAVKL